jgi:hypothetical protein
MTWVLLPSSLNPGPGTPDLRSSSVYCRTHDAQPWTRFNSVLRYAAALAHYRLSSELKKDASEWHLSHAFY